MHNGFRLLSCGPLPPLTIATWPMPIAGGIKQAQPFTLILMCPQLQSSAIYSTINPVLFYSAEGTLTLQTFISGINQLCYCSAGYWYKNKWIRA